MPTYAYQAIDPQGSRVNGTLEAENRDAAAAVLLTRNLRLVRLDERASGPRSAFSLGGRVRLSSLVVFSRQFATMYNAGIRIVHCLEVLERQTTDAVLKRVLGQVRQDVLAGLTLNEAMAKHPKVFDPLFVNMVRAGETGGILDKVLDRLAAYKEAQQELYSEIRKAMTYPIVVITLSFIVTGVLVVFVLPKFQMIFTEMGIAQKLPKPTQILFAISNLVRTYWYLLPAALVGAIAAIRAYGSTESGRYNLDLLKLKLPIVGPLVQKISISRFARTFATLQAAGVPMLRSMEIVAATAGNAVISRAVDRAKDNVREGRRLATPLEESGWFPSLVTQMISVGEDTGQLSDMLEKVSDFYDREVDTAIKSLTSLIEPVMIAFMGVLIGCIAVSVISPIFALQRELMRR
ncbi:MAG: type II secretion system F family protein [Armatimonadota bacterium]